MHNTNHDINKISVIVDDSMWIEKYDYEFWCSQVKTISKQVRRQDLCFSVLLTNDDKMQELNLQFRNQNNTTNVLAFPEYSPKEISCGAARGFIGDIAISYKRIAQEAQLGKITFIDHFAHLLVHSILHLLGFDHIKDKDAKIMEICEVAILTKLGISNPYV